MKEYVWLFPIIFMFHDMEEIIGFKFFLRQNTAELQQRFPFILRRYKDFSTEGFALAVYEELILCIAISTLAYFIDRNFLWYIWLGAFLGCDLHFFIHLNHPSPIYLDNSGYLHHSMKPDIIGMLFFYPVMTIFCYLLSFIIMLKVVIYFIQQIRYALI